MRVFAPLRDASVALLWGGLSLSAIGDQLYAVALTWIAVGVFGAASGYLGALGAGCVLGTALFGGRWTDLWEQRGAMIGADLARAAALGLVVLAWILAGRPLAAALVMATVVLAGGQAVFRPALQSLLPAMARDARQLPATNALLDTTERIARLLGPGLVALLAPLVPTMHFLSLDALSFLLSACVLWRIGWRRRVPRLRREGPREKMAAAVSRGFHTLARHRVLGFELAITGPLNGAWYATYFLGLPLIIAHHHVTGPGGSGLGAYGLVISAYGCTNLLATLVVGGRDLPVSPGRLVFAGNIALGAGMMVIALAELMAVPAAMLLPVYASAAALSAMVGPMHDIPVAVLRQTELPRADVPAAMRASLVANNFGLLLAMLAVPGLFTVLGAGPVLAGCAVLVLTIGCVGLVRFSGPKPEPGSN